jgi:type VI secretion system secreted protein Hcp
MAIYLKYGNIKGDATESGFEQWINVVAFKWGPAVKRDIRTDTGRAHNREHAQPHMTNITIDKEFDHSTGCLLKELVTVPQAKTAEIAFVRTNPDGGDAATYLHYTLDDALLAKVDITDSEASVLGGGHGADRPKESWVINFTAVQVEVKQLDLANVSGAAYKFKYHLATGKEA